MSSFRSKPIGWRYESSRHALAARGISTNKNYMMTKKLSEDELNDRRNTREAYKGQLKQAEKIAEIIRGVNKSKSGSGEKKERGLRGVPADIRAERQTESLIERGVIADMPFNQAMEQVKNGLYAGRIHLEPGQDARYPQGGNFPIEGLLSRESTVLSEGEKSALKQAVINKAVEQVTTGYISQEKLPEFTRNLIKEGRTKGVFGIEKKTAAEKEIVAAEKRKTEIEKSPFKKAAEEYAESKLKGAVGAVAAVPGEAAEFAGGAAKEEFKLFEEAAPSYTKDIKTYPGWGETVEKFDASPFFQMNAAIGNEEDGEFKFMGNEKRDTTGTFKPYTPAHPEQVMPFGNAGDAWGNLAGIQKGQGMTKEKQVQKEVSSLHTAKGKLAKIDLTPFAEGTKAFKVGDREKLTNSIDELSAQKQMLKDRYSMVQQTRRKMLTTDNQEELFEDGGGFSVFGGGGGSKLADETRKMSEVNAELSKSANQVADREFILRSRLARLDARVPVETAVPEKVMVVPDESNKKSIVERAGDSEVVEKLMRG